MGIIIIAPKTPSMEKIIIHEVPDSILPDSMSIIDDSEMEAAQNPTPKMGLDLKSLILSFQSVSRESRFRDDEEPFFSRTPERAPSQNVYVEEAITRATIATLKNRLEDPDLQKTVMTTPTIEANNAARDEENNTEKIASTTQTQSRKRLVVIARLER
jgi:hypothetical protein